MTNNLHFTELKCHQWFSSNMPKPFIWPNPNPNPNPNSNPNQPSNLYYWSHTHKIGIFWMVLASRNTSRWVTDCQIGRKKYTNTLFCHASSWFWDLASRHRQKSVFAFCFLRKSIPNYSKCSKWFVSIMLNTVLESFMHQSSWWMRFGGVRVVFRAVRQLRGVKSDPFQTSNFYFWSHTHKLGILWKLVKKMPSVVLK